MDAATHFSLAEAARVLQVNESRIRTLVRLGGIVSDADAEPRFTFQQLLLLRTTHGLLESGVPERRVRRMWTSLRDQVAGDQPLTSVRVLAEGDHAVVSDGATTWEPDSGQFVLDFGGGPADPGEPGEAGAGREPESAGATAAGEPPRRPAPRGPAVVTPLIPERAEPPARVASGRAAPTATATIEADGAEQWFQIASDLEGSSPEEARQAYRRALEADPGFAEAHLNLGRLDHEAGELGRAEAHYRDAVRCAPADAMPHFNLGVLLEDRGRPEEAVLAYKQAILRDPELADAHYNLGLLLESRARRSEALKHLMIARRLYDRASGAE